MRGFNRINERIRSYWEGRFNPLQFFIMFLLIIFMVNWLHEFFHLRLGILLGGEGYVKIGFLVFYTEFTVDPSPMLPVVFAGGLGSAAVCGLVWVMDTDIENRIVWRAVGLTQVLYGLVEGLLFHLGRYDLLPQLGTIAMLVAAVYAFITSKAMWDSKSQ